VLFAQLVDAFLDLALLPTEVCELVHAVAVGQCSPFTSTWWRSCATSIATSPLLIRHCQARLNTSIASKLVGSRMRRARLEFGPLQGIVIAVDIF
jgi:hypothetical protein